jgi:hypothetical protein
MDFTKSKQISVANVLEVPTVLRGLQVRSAMKDKTTLAVEAKNKAARGNCGMLSLIA